MPTTKELKPLSPWKEVRTTKRDWDRADPRRLGSMLA